MLWERGGVSAVPAMGHDKRVPPALKAPCLRIFPDSLNLKQSNYSSLVQAEPE